MNLLDVHNLNIDFAATGRVLPMVSNVSFGIGRGEILALVGESGCGKSISCLALTGLLPSPPARVRADRIHFETPSGTVDLATLPPRRMRRIRGGKIAYVFQEPSVSLNPVFRVGDQIAEVLELHRPEVADVRSKVIELLKDVGIPAPETRIDAFPHEMSGGMQQRVMIAMALCCNPGLLIADEPTTALDVTIQAQIISLMKELQKKMGMSIVLITHDLGVVADIADEIVVMYAGKIVEKGKCRDIFYRRRHPYTWALLKSVPRVDYEKKQPLVTIEGGIPDMTNPPKGCAFCQRCPYAMNICSEYEPTKTTLADGHEVWCWLLDKRADLSKVPEEIRRRKDEQ